MHPSSEPRSRALFATCTALLAAAFASVAVVAGRRLLHSGLMFPPDVLFGFDIDRAIHDIADPGFLNPRSNVHPLFQLLTSPFGLLIRKLGPSMGTAAILLNAVAGAAALCIAAWYLRLRGAGRMETWLAVFLMASGTTWLWQTSFPSTPIFSLGAIGLCHILLVWNLRRPDPLLAVPIRRMREGLWLLGGVVNYGLTVTNGFIVFLLYGFSRRGKQAWIRAAIFGAIVLATGMAASWLAGSSLNLIAEKQWVDDPAVRGPQLNWPLLESASTSLFWGVDAPIPSSPMTTDQRHWTILAFLEWHYGPAGWLLMAGWSALLAAAFWMAAQDRDSESRRLTGAALATLGFHVLLHRFYVISYEGLILWSGHGYFMAIALLAPLLSSVSGWSPARRRLFQIAVLALAAGLALHNIKLLLSLNRLVGLPPGYSAIKS